MVWTDRHIRDNNAKKLDGESPIRAKERFVNARLRLG